jgi:putative ABC transport system permease protein
LWTFASLEILWQDIRYGARQLRLSPGFTVVSALTLALGVGGTVAIYSLFDTVLWRPMADPNLRNLAIVAQAIPGQPHLFAPASLPDLQDIRANAASFQGLALFRNTASDLVDPGGQPFRVESAQVAPDFFPTVGTQPALGRTFTAGETGVVVLSDDLWRTRFGANPDITGTTIRVDGRDSTVIGVMPPGFTLPRVNRKLWLPLDASAADRAEPSAMAMGLLKPGLSVRQAEVEMNAVAARLERDYPETNRGRRFVAWTYQRFLIGDYVPIFEALLLGAAIFVLLIACANVAGLQVARATSRWRELSLRAALGASRGRVVRQLLTESLLLAFCGTIVGLFAARWGLVVLKANIPPDMRTYMPGWAEIGLHLPALLFASACAAVSGLATGLAPAWRSSRPALAESLKEGGRGGTNSRARLRSILVAAELAAAVVLVIGAGLMVRGFRSLIGAGAHLDPQHVLTLRVSLNPVRYRSPLQETEFYREVLDRVTPLPGVRSAIAISAMPFSRTSDSAPFLIEARQSTSDPAQVRAVSPGYFRALSIPLLSGTLDLEAPASALVSESAARRWSVSAGQRIQMHPPDGPWLSIAGVVGDTQQTILSRDPEPTVYFSYRQFPRREMDIALRTAPEAMQLAAAARAAIRAVDPEQPITSLSSLAAMIDQEAFVFAYMAALMGIFGLISLGLSAIGVYGVMSYVVSQQRHEIGVRIALGAPRAAVMRMLFRRGMRTAGTGLLLGLLPAYGLARLMRSAVWGVSLADPALFTVIPLTLLTAAALAIYIPARRGTRIDPILALRDE